MAQSTKDAEKLAATLHDIQAESFADELGRNIVKDALLGALRRVQLPWDTIQDHLYQHPADAAVIKTLIDVNFWRKWVDAGAVAGTVEELAKFSDGIDPALLRRLLRMLAGQHYVQEIASDTFGPTPFSKALADEKFFSSYISLFGVFQPAFANLPKFFAETNYANPTDANKSNWQSWQGPGTDPFSYLIERPELGKAFNITMTVYSAIKTPWTAIYPTETIIAAGASRSDRVLVVDVGGGVGHDLEKFRAKHSDVAPGSLVLQDLPHVVANAIVKAPAIVQGRDFFEAQPVIGARVYYLHTVLHDWPAEKAVAILKALIPALERGFSRILVHEVVVPDRNAHPRATLSDVTMMMSFSAEERSEKAWRAIATDAGLVVTKIWKDTQDGYESIIELELA